MPNAQNRTSEDYADPGIYRKLEEHESLKLKKYLELLVQDKNSSNSNVEIIPTRTGVRSVF